MLAGRVQLGDTFFVDRLAPEIPLTGDFGQDQPVTYATLAPFSSAWEADENSTPATGGERRVSDRSEPRWPT
ncbi:MAG: hypothetical protein R2849_09565 [Thermomicrobiales bacterium]